MVKILIPLKASEKDKENFDLATVSVKFVKLKKDILTFDTELAFLRDLKRP